MLSWLLLAVLGIIWAAFLLPSWRRSPTSTVEEFEQKMTMLAEPNKTEAGRWVLVPQKGRRFLGPQDRQRMRFRRRRRAVFMTLLELCGLTFLMGLFPPLRPMLVGTVILGIVLVAYAVLLVKVRAEESSRVRDRRSYGAAFRRAAYGNGNGHASPYAEANGGNGRSYGVPARTGLGGGTAHQEYLLDRGAEIMDEDVHIIVRRSDEIDLQALRASGGRAE